jgi:uncharacterized protein YbcI
VAGRSLQGLRFREPPGESHGRDMSLKPFEDTSRDGDRALLPAVAAEVVRLFKERFGRGPTRARAEWAGRDALVVVLEDTLTPAERRLAQMGEHERLRETRMFFQYASVSEFCDPIERLTGRKVRVFISGLDAAADGLAAEVFVLHPEGYDGPSRSEL